MFQRDAHWCSNALKGNNTLYKHLQQKQSDVEFLSQFMC